MFDLCHHKVLPSHKAHRLVLISISFALSQTWVYTARPQILGFSSYVCIPAFAGTHWPTTGGMARLSWPCWLG